MAATPLTIPENYASLGPVRQLGTNGDALEHLLHPGNAEHALSPDMLRIIADVQRQFRSVTMIIPEHKRPHQSMLRDPAMKRRTGKGPFFFVPERGTILARAHPQRQRFEILASIG